MSLVPKPAGVGATTADTYLVSKSRTHQVACSLTLWLGFLISPLLGGEVLSTNSASAASRNETQHRAVVTDWVYTKEPITLTVSCPEAAHALFLFHPERVFCRGLAVVSVPCLHNRPALSQLPKRHIAPYPHVVISTITSCALRRALGFRHFGPAPAAPSQLFPKAPTHISF